MGSIHLPRLYFTGYQYWNPNTVNNNDYGGDEPFAVNTWDPPKADFDWEYLESQGVSTDEEIPPFLRTNIEYQPKTRRMPPAEWGYYGGQECGFVTDASPKIADRKLFSAPDQKTLTTGYTDSAGHYGRNSDEEPWVGLELQLEPAKLVDVNPMSFWTSQVFADKFTLGTSATGFSAQPVARMHSRFISSAKRNYNSNNDLVIAAGFGAVFQTCFEKPPAEGGVCFAGSGGRIQQQFQDAFDSGAAGLMLRYSAYSTLYFQGDVFAGLDPGDRYPLLEKMGDLYEQYANKELADPPISRAYSRVAGWIGLWMPGELVSVPGGRFLIPFGQQSATSKHIAGAGPIAVTPSNLEPAQYQPPPADTPPNTDAPVSAPQPLGPATVEIETDAGGNAVRATLDFGNTIPERDSSGVKADFGTVKLGLSLPDSSVKWVSQDVLYDQDAYERTGGLVDISCNAIARSDLAEGSFFLQVESGQKGSSNPTTALWETLVTAQTDTRGMYAEQPDAPFSGADAATPGPGVPSTTPSCEVAVRVRGAAPTGVSVKLEWQALDYQLNSYPPGKLPIEVFYRDASNELVPFDGPIDVPDSGAVEVRLRASHTAIPNLLFLPYTAEQGGYCGAPFVPPQGIGSAYYAAVKCLTRDNSLAEEFDAWLEPQLPEPLVTEVVWRLVFENYYYGFPVMNFINQDNFAQYASAIFAVTDPRPNQQVPRGFDGSGYMPVTRTWSAGKRHIMSRYCAYLEARGGAKADSARGRRFEPPEPDGRVEATSESPTGENLGHG